MEAVNKKNKVSGRRLCGVGWTRPGPGAHRMAHAVLMPTFVIVQAAPVKLHQAKSYLWVFVNCLVENPTFDSQTKENMTLRASAFGSKCDLSEEFHKKCTCGPSQGHSRVFGSAFASHGARSGRPLFLCLMIGPLSSLVPHDRAALVACAS